MGAHGCPLCPGDFHSQTIMITDVDTHLRITGVIDWEFSGPEFAPSFAVPPLHRRSPCCANGTPEIRPLPTSSKRSVFAIWLATRSFHISSPMATASTSSIEEVMHFPVTFSKLFPLLLRKYSARIGISQPSIIVR